MVLCLLAPGKVRCKASSSALEALHNVDISCDKAGDSISITAIEY